MSTGEISFLNESFLRFKDWLVTRGPWWATSVTVHALILVAMTFIVVATPSKQGDAPAFEANPDTVIPDPEIDRFDVGETPLEPTELNTETLSLVDAPQMAQDEQINTTPDDPFVEAGGGTASGTTADPLGGLGGFSVMATGPGAAVKGPGGVGGGIGTGTSPGTGGAGSGFAGRGSGVRKAMLGSYGGTKGSERAVAAALNWFARHQMPDGRWSLGGYPKVCKDPSCTGHGDTSADVAATSMALLPFLAAGQTHKSRGPYQKTIYGGLSFLLRQQKKDGDLQGGNTMYSHGLAAITLCEAYGLTHDQDLYTAAQAAVNFIQTAQHPQTGGWHYAPGGTGDTSVVGWQVMGLKSGQMASLSVSPSVFVGAKTWLKSVASSRGGLFSYTQGSGPSDTMVSVGLLCSQYMGAKRTDESMKEGMEYLMSHLPDIKNRNCYYWYYGTQVMHNMPGPEWDTWNRQMRRVLIESQVKTEGACAAGSWDPKLPTHDTWGGPGGRIMVTSLCCLTLEVYYRYLPLYKLDQGEGDALAEQPPAEKDPAAKEKPAAKRARTK